MDFSLVFLILNQHFFPYHMGLLGHGIKCTISKSVEGKLAFSFFYQPVPSSLEFSLREHWKNPEVGSWVEVHGENLNARTWNCPSEQSLPTVLGFSPICLRDSPFSLTQPSVSRQMIHSQCIFLLLLNRPSNHHCIFQFQLTAWTAVFKNVTKQACLAREIMQNPL